VHISLERNLESFGQRQLTWLPSTYSTALLV
jgi:hypothetical protein